MAGVGQKVAIMSAAATAGLVALTKVAVDQASAFQQNRIAFETMLGSADKAKALLADISKFAMKTPFELPQLVEGSKRLLAYGIEGEKVIPTMKTLGNISAGVGMDKLPALILAFGQVKAATKLTGMELRQFSEAGVPLLGTLAREAKVTEREMIEMVSKGAVSFEQVNNALAGMSGEGGKFFNLMEKQSKTFGGTVSNIKDQIGRLLRSAVGISEEGDIRKGSIFDILTQAATRFMDFLSNIQPQIDQFMHAVEGFLQQIINGMPAVLEAVGKFFQFLFEHKEIVISIFVALGLAVGVWVATIVAANITIVAIFTAIVAALTALQLAWKHNFLGIQDIVTLFLSVFQGRWGDAWEAVKRLAQAGWNFLSGIFKAILDHVVNWGKDILHFLVAPFEEAWNNIKETVNKIKDALDFTKRHSPSVLDIVNHGVNEVNKALGRLILEPSIHPAVIGAGGGNMSNFSTINISLDGAIIGDEFSATQIGEKIGDSIIKRLQNNVRF